MPNYKGHLAGGVATFTILFLLLHSFCTSFLTAAGWLVFTLAGSLFPDIDIKSKGQKYFYRLVLLFFIVLTFNHKFELMCCFSFIAITPMLVRHRGVFHQVWFLVIVSFGVWMAMSCVMPGHDYPLFFNALCFLAGALSHVLLDILL